MEETLGIPAKHLQCAAVQAQALNFKLVSLGPGNSEAAAGQTFTQAHYCFSHDCTAGESLWMALMWAGQKFLCGFPRRHPSAAALFGRERFCPMHSFWMGPFICSASLLYLKAGHLSVSVQGKHPAFWSTVFNWPGTVPGSVKAGASFVGWAVPDADKIVQGLIWTKFLLTELIAPSQVSFTFHS